MTACYINNHTINPLLHSVLNQNFDFKTRRDYGKKFPERCVYEAVGDKSLFEFLP